MALALCYLAWMELENGSFESQSSQTVVPFGVNDLEGQSATYSSIIQEHTRYLLPHPPSLHAPSRRRRRRRRRMVLNPHVGRR